MAVPTLPAAGAVQVGQKTGIAQILNQLIAAVRYLLADPGNPYPLSRSGTTSASTNSSGQIAVSYLAFPSAESGAVTVTVGTAYACYPLVTAHSNGAFTVTLIGSNGSALGSGVNLTLGWSVTGN